MQEDQAYTPDKKTRKKVRERLRGSRAELSWLMRTSYISNETENRRQAATPRAKPAEAAERNMDADEAHVHLAEVHAP